MYTEVELEATFNVTRAFDLAIDHAIASQPNTRAEFSWYMMPYLIAWLTQAGLLDSAIMARWQRQSDKYGQISLREEVK